MLDRLEQPAGGVRCRADPPRSTVELDASQEAANMMLVATAAAPDGTVTVARAPIQPGPRPSSWIWVPTPRGC